MPDGLGGSASFRSGTPVEKGLEIASLGWLGWLGFKAAPLAIEYDAQMVRDVFRNRLCSIERTTIREFFIAAAILRDESLLLEIVGCKIVFLQR